MIELNGIQLDKTSAVPLYEQLRKALLEAITSGKLSAGTKLPTEEELCAQFAKKEGRQPRRLTTC